ncbi:hypothetical protein [Alloactinosynnema sp. L-07]|uniref:hypothetical protein n=1 Tax=Alloactinosynnema sp. L-07 TaxID=1653480 RepID=UPI00065F01B3|nr:hypothetical protein [Alloactinosynnema sp. L-07]CRK55425.1 hypothetical protein [Alloactinosynnema sp. L-07]
MLDLYRGRLTYRRVCALVQHLPPDAALWRALDPDHMTRHEVLLATVERRVTVLWATVAAALGHQVPDDQLIGPLDTARAARAADGEAEPETRTLRDIAQWMRT